MKKNGKCPGGTDAAELFKEDAEGVRDILAKLLLQAGFDKACAHPLRKLVYV